MNQALEILSTQSVATFFDDRAAALNAEWSATSQALMRLVGFGLLMLDTKEQGKATGEIPHGQFQRWIEKNCPSINYRAAARYMNLAAFIADKTKSDTRVTFDNLPLHQVLLTPTDSLDSLPKEAVEIRDEIFSLVDGKSQRQLLFEFREEKAPTPKKHHPRKPVDPVAAADAETQLHRDHMRATLGHMTQLRDPAAAAALSKTDHAEIIAACVQLADFYRTLSKKGSK